MSMPAFGTRALPTVVNSWSVASHTLQGTGVQAAQCSVAALCAGGTAKARSGATSSLYAALTNGWVVRMDAKTGKAVAVSAGVLDGTHAVYHHGLSVHKSSSLCFAGNGVDARVRVVGKVVAWCLAWPAADHVSPPPPV